MCNAWWLKVAMHIVHGHFQSTSWSVSIEVFIDQKNFPVCLIGNHYENLNDASLSVAADHVRKSSNTDATPPTTERREELIKEVKTTRHSTQQQKSANQKSAAQIKKEAEEDARVKQVCRSLVQLNPARIHQFGLPNPKQCNIAGMVGLTRVSQ